MLFWFHFQPGCHRYRLFNGNGGVKLVVSFFAIFAPDLLRGKCKMGPIKRDFGDPFKGLRRKSPLKVGSKLRLQRFEYTLNSQLLKALFELLKWKIIATLEDGRYISSGALFLLSPETR